MSSPSVEPDCRIEVRAMRPDEVGIRIDYFHDATDEHLRKIGVDRALLPSRQAWHETYRNDFARPVEQRESYLLSWLLDGVVVGFSSTDRIAFGDEAYMHLHIVEPRHRAAGLGTRFVRLSAGEYFRVLQLRRLYCQPNAFNVAPNRTLQNAGFRYVCTVEEAPNPINVVQPVTRWVMESASS